MWEQQKLKEHRFGRALGVLTVLTVLTGSAVADAEDGIDEEAEAELEADDAEGADQPSEPEREPAPAEDETGPAGSSSGEHSDDGGRFRFGIAGGGGPLSTDGIDLTYYGMDLRFGWQLSNALGIYAQPQLGYYKLDGVSAEFGSGGLLGMSVVADYTLFDRLFIGGGLGYAILNNPSGTELHLRAGGYPLLSVSEETQRRKGLMLGIDFRLHFVEGYTFVAPTFNIGYESF